MVELLEQIQQVPIAEYQTHSQKLTENNLLEQLMEEHKTSSGLLSIINNHA